LIEEAKCRFDFKLLHASLGESWQHSRVKLPHSFGEYEKALFSLNTAKIRQVMKKSKIANRGDFIIS
jgi:hypothetical protein